MEGTGILLRSLHGRIRRLMRWSEWVRHQMLENRVFFSLKPGLGPIEVLSFPSGQALKLQMRISGLDGAF